MWKKKVGKLMLSHTALSENGKIRVLYFCCFISTLIFYQIYCKRQKKHMLTKPLIENVSYSEWNSAMFSRCDWRCTVNHLLCKKGYFSYLAISIKALKHESVLRTVKLFQLVGTFLLAAITVHRNCCFPHQQKAGRALALSDLKANIFPSRLFRKET